MFKFVGILSLALLAGAIGGFASEVGGRCLPVSNGWDCVQQLFSSERAKVPAETQPEPTSPGSKCLTLEDAKSIHSLAEIIGIGRVGDLSGIEQKFSGASSSGCVDLKTVLSSSCELLSGGAAGNCSQI